MAMSASARRDAATAGEFDAVRDSIVATTSGAFGITDDIPTDPEKLREWLNATARQLADSQRAKGRPAPDYLQEAIDLSGPPDQLPRDEKTALQKARDWFQSMTVSPGDLTDDFEIIREYRSRGDLSEEDQQVLDAAEEQLRNQIKKQSDG